MECNNFFCLPKEYSNYDRSKAVIQQIAYEETSTYQKGTKNGPKALMAASHNIELFDEELRRDFFDIGISTSQPINKFSDIYSLIMKHLNNEKFIISIGGEHTITLPIIKAFKEKYKHISILQIDAHSDLKDNYNGQQTHATVMRRVFELGNINLVQLPVRSLDAEEYSFIKNNSIKTFFAHGRGLSWNLRSIIKELGNYVYLTIDVDGLDPGIMPAVGTPEPNGLLWNDLYILLKDLFLNREVIGADIVEFMPLTNLKFPDISLAKLIYKLIGYKFFLKDN